MKKWIEMRTWLVGYPIDRSGFLQVLKLMEKRLYYKLILHGLEFLEEDRGIVRFKAPDMEKKFPRRSDNGLRKHNSKVQASDGRSKS